MISVKREREREMCKGNRLEIPEAPIETVTDGDRGKRISLTLCCCCLLF